MLLESVRLEVQVRRQYDRLVFLNATREQLLSVFSAECQSLIGLGPDDLEGRRVDPVLSPGDTEVLRDKFQQRLVHARVAAQVDRNQTGRPPYVRKYKLHDLG